MKSFLKRTIVFKLFRVVKSTFLNHGFVNSILEFDFSKDHSSLVPEKLKNNSNRKVVVGIGHQDWEKFGFWDSFEDIFDFSFVEINYKQRNLNFSALNSIMDKILYEINDISSKKRIDFVFFYCDAAYLKIELFEILNKMKIPSVMMGLDDKHRFKKHRINNTYSGQELIIPYLRLYWTTWKSLSYNLNLKGIHAVYLAEGANPRYHNRVINKKKDIDVLFIGNAYGSRRDIVNFLIKNGIKVQSFGSGWQNGYVSFEQSVDLYNRSKIVLGVGDVGHSSDFKHLKGRDFEATMCGCCYITSYNPELADWFEIGKEILCYSSNIELLEQIKYYLHNDIERERIGDNAFLRSINNHTWHHRIETLLNELYESNKTTD